MKHFTTVHSILFSFLLLLCFEVEPISAQKAEIENEVKNAMHEATRFMVEEVSVQGGYLRLYTKDFSRRWGEMEAYETQFWIGGNIPFTQDMGELFLDAYEVTGDEYYYRAAEQVARALIWAQLESGGWDHIADFAGDRSLKRWYETIGANAWGWDEYTHYYGNATYKDDCTSSAARFLLRIYLEKMDPAFKPALDKAIDFILESQYPLGGWPQRYPPERQYQYNGKQDYTSFSVFNDDLTWENAEVLIDVYLMLGEERVLDPIRRAMNFYLMTQGGNPQAGWGQQYDMDLQPAHGRQYEPAALRTTQSYRHGMLMMDFYELTGDRKFLARTPDLLAWLERTRLFGEETEGGTYTHPLFVELKTNDPLYIHRKRSGVENGHGEYWIDHNDENTISYGGKTNLDSQMEQLQDRYEELTVTDANEVAAGSPLSVGRFTGEGMPQDRYSLEYRSDPEHVSTEDVEEILRSLDEKGRWLTTGEWISDPYTVDEEGNPSNTALLSVEHDHTAILDNSGQEFISTRVYIDRMRTLLNYLRTM